jgi:HSP20 family molecular chaperone IbpA
MAKLAIEKYTEPETVAEALLEQGLTITEAIRLRAYDLFLSRGGENGFDVDDWLQAERDVVSSATPIELVEHDNDFQARIDLTGLGVQQIQVFATPNSLVIKAEVTKTAEGEFSGKMLFQSVELPASIDVDQLSASLDGGILQVTLPKTAAKAITATA